MKRSIIILFFFLSISHLGQGQVNLSGVINEYAAVLDVKNRQDWNTDSLKLDDVTGFNVGDTVLLYIQKGGQPFTMFALIGDLMMRRNVGTFQIYVIYDVFPGTNEVEIVSPITDISNFNSNNTAQLVRVRGVDDPVINGEVTCPEYDPVTRKGGIVAIMANGNITFDNGGINVSGAGFKGADPTGDNFTGNCSGTNDGYFELEIGKNEMDSAGLKGESVLAEIYEGYRGRGRSTNGGGGGFGMFSGGAGGGNFGTGGKGGYEIHTCSKLDSNIYGGRILQDFYTIVGPNRYSIFFGGGGGASTGNSSYPATKGGDGGGIVILLADTIKSTNGYIRANGEDVADMAYAGGGGGGGGGVVVVDAEIVVGDLEISVKGGKGGDTNHPTDTTGPGGGGGGGVIWHATAALNGFTPLLDGGLNGDYAPVGSKGYGALSGSLGSVLDSMVVPVRAFLFNLVAGNQYICEGETPDTIYASRPKGGFGVYTFEWQQSSDQSSWSPAIGVNNKRHYAPPALTDTTYYRRIVESVQDTTTITDVSSNVIIYVHDAVNNSISAIDQELCSGDTPTNMDANVPSGGDNQNYEIRWQFSDDNSNWNDIGITTEDYQPPALFDSVYYRRKVISGACNHNSNQIEVLVHSEIQNANILDNQLLCESVPPDTLISTGTLSGGILSYNFTWEESEDSSSWSLIGSANDEKYYPGVLFDTVFYRRNIQSGPCAAQSNVVKITVQPKLTGNSIQNNQSICYNTAPTQFTSSTVIGGGDIGFYSYSWQKSDTGSFVDISVLTENYQAGQLLDSTSYRRIVISGGCIDTSNTIHVNVRDSIFNEISSSNQEICQGYFPDTIKAQPASGGDGVNYSYSWQVGIDTLSFSDASGLIDQENYVPDNIATRYFRRTAISGSCQSFSRIVEVFVLDSIENNEILNGNIQYTCYNTVPILLSTGSLTGGNGSYTYKWLKSVDDSSWSDADGNNNQEGYSGPALTDSVYYKRIVFSGTIDACKDTSSSVKILINPLPTGSLIALMDTMCSNDSLPLSFNLAGNAPFEVVLSNNTDSTIKSDITESFDSAYVKSRSSGIFNIARLTDANGCNAVQKNGEVNIIVFDVPVLFAGNDTSVCGPIIEMDASADVGTTYWVYSDTIVAFNDDSSPTAIAEVQSYGVHDFFWHSIEGICHNSDTITVTFFEMPESSDIPDTNIFFNFETVLEAAIPSAGVGFWTADDRVDIADDSSNISDFTFPYKEYDDYGVFWHVINGVCPEVIDTINIQISYLKIPNGFSPNDDAKNQFFVIKGLEYTKENRIVVMNRWGNVIFEADDYQNDWEGTTSDGKPLPEDTYYYVFSYDGGRTHKGFMVIKR